MKRRFFASTIEELRRLDGYIDARRHLLSRCDTKGRPADMEADAVGQLRSEVSNYDRFKTAYIQKHGIWPSEAS